MKPSSPGKISVDMPKREGRILPAEAVTSSRAVRMPASEAASGAGQKPERPGAAISPVRRAAPSQAWTEGVTKHVISAIAAVPAVRAWQPAAGAAAASAAEHRGAPVAAAGVAAVVAAGGSHETIPIINTATFKGEDDDASRNRY
jgi:hypothetical protein